MALINCRECGKEISDKATACPNCGFPLPKLTQASIKKKENGCLNWLLLIAAVPIMLGIVTAVNHSSDNDITSDKSIPAKEVNPSAPKIGEAVSADKIIAQGYVPPIGEIIPSRDSATYSLMDIYFKGKNVIITTQRDGKSGRSYSTREVKCPGKQARYLATGDSLEEFKASKMNQSFSESYPDSIQGEIASYACTQLFVKNLSK